MPASRWSPSPPQEGRELGLKLGDTITVNILGRNVTARIASFRTVKWETMGINFVMVFSPNTFAGAPHAWIATLTDPRTPRPTRNRRSSTP